jgi:hypothetical protein
MPWRYVGEWRYSYTILDLDSRWRWMVTFIPCPLFSLLAIQPPLALASDFQVHDHFTDGRTPWTGDQLVAKTLPKHRTTQTQNKHIYIPNIRALCGIRTHDPGFWASEDISCLRPLGYRDRPGRCGERNSSIRCNNIPRFSIVRSSLQHSSWCYEVLSVYWIKLFDWSIVLLKGCW